MATGFDISRKKDVCPMLLGPQYKCSFCPKTFRSLQARGGHMTTHRQEVKENRRKHKEYMAKKVKEFTMDLLQPNTTYWRRYRKGKEKPEEIIFFPMQMPRALANDGKSSCGPLPSENIVTDLAAMFVAEDKKKGGEVETVHIDLTLKL